MELSMTTVVRPVLNRLDEMVQETTGLHSYAQATAVALIRVCQALNASGADETLAQFHEVSWIVDAFAECGIFTGCAWSCAGCGKVCGKNRFEGPVPEVKA